MAISGKDSWAHTAEGSSVPGPGSAACSGHPDRSGAGLEPGTPWSPGHCLFGPMSGKKLQELLCTHVGPFSLLQKQSLGPLEILGQWMSKGFDSP